MTSRYPLVLAAFGAAIAPVSGRAQRRVPPPAPVVSIARTPPLPAPTPERIAPASEGSARWHRIERSWGYPLLLESGVSSPAAVPIPYPVPVYYPLPVPARQAPERPPAPPYDPTKSRMTIVGGGADGGGGVMRIERNGPDSLQLTWLVPTRPVQSATFFLADDTHARLRSHAVDTSRPRVAFGLAQLRRAPTFAGLTVLFLDGSQRTTLVPLKSLLP